MSTPDFLTLASQYGPVGLMLCYLIWDKVRCDRIEKDRLERAEVLQKERIAADLALAHSLTMLEVAIKARLD